MKVEFIWIFIQRLLSQGLDGFLFLLIVTETKLNQLQLTDQSINQTINQSVDKPIIQAINRSITTANGLIEKTKKNNKFSWPVTKLNTFKLTLREACSPSSSQGIPISVDFPATTEQ